ncbi:signal peptidase I [Streptomyces sp. KLOTTS4A1]|uniref:signal peptidase I n=1 Tax=Streptomyces sp. KLOTTS4A1 TaxID=3390996 RepID=UPI0039F52794
MYDKPNRCEQADGEAFHQVTDGVYAGRADRDAALDRGWLLGHFKEPGDPRHCADLEIKWGVHPKGEGRAAWAVGEVRTALLVLISGRFRLEFPGRDIVLEEQGDYVMWGKGVDHSWYAEEDAVVLTVRWPSVPGYRVEPHGTGQEAAALTRPDLG